MGYSTSFKGTFLFDKALSPETVALIERLENDSRDFKDGVTYPGAYCQWILTGGRTGLGWDNNEKFYDYVEWLQFIIDEILKPAGVKLTGTVNYSGDDPCDCGLLIVGDDQKAILKPMPIVTDEYVELLKFRDFVLNTAGAEDIKVAWKAYRG